MSLADDLLAILTRDEARTWTEDRDDILTLFSEYVWAQKPDHVTDGKGYVSIMDLATEIRPFPRTVEIEREHLRTLVEDASRSTGHMDRVDQALNHVREIAPDVFAPP